METELTVGAWTLGAQDSAWNAAKMMTGILTTEGIMVQKIEYPGDRKRNTISPCGYEGFLAI